MFLARFPLRRASIFKRIRRYSDSHRFLTFESRRADLSPPGSKSQNIQNTGALTAKNHQPNSSVKNEILFAFRKQRILTSAHVDLLVETFSGYDELTMLTFADKPQLFLRISHLRNLQDIEQMSHDELREVLQCAKVPENIWGAQSAHELRISVRNLMLAMVEKMNQRELQQHLEFIQWRTFEQSTEQLRTAVRLWIQQPDCSLFKVTRYHGHLIGKHFTDRSMKNLRFLRNHEIIQLPVMQLRELLAQRNQNVTGNREQLIRRLIAFQEFVVLRVFTDGHAREMLKKLYWISGVDHISGFVLRKRCILALRHPNVSQFIPQIRPVQTGAWTEHEDSTLIKCYEEARRIIAHHQNQLNRDPEDQKDLIHELFRNNSDLRLDKKTVYEAAPITAFDGDTKLWSYEDELKWRDQHVDIWKLCAVMANTHYQLSRNAKQCETRWITLKLRKQPVSNTTNTDVHEKLSETTVQPREDPIPSVVQKLFSLEIEVAPRKASRKKLDLIKAEALEAKSTEWPIKTIPELERLTAKELRDLLKLVSQPFDGDRTLLCRRFIIAQDHMIEKLLDEKKVVDHLSEYGWTRNLLTIPSNLLRRRLQIWTRYPQLPIFYPALSCLKKRFKDWSKEQDDNLMSTIKRCSEHFLLKMDSKWHSEVPNDFTKQQSVSQQSPYPSNITFLNYVLPRKRVEMANHQAKFWSAVSTLLLTKFGTRRSPYMCQQRYERLKAHGFNTDAANAPYLFKEPSAKPYHVVDSASLKQTDSETNGAPIISSLSLFGKSSEQPAKTDSGHGAWKQLKNLNE